MAGVMTSESPATQSRSFFLGVNATFFGFAGGGFGVVGFVGFGVAGVCVGMDGVGDAVREGRSRVDLVVVRSPDRRLDRLAGPVEEKRVAHVCERPGEGEGDVPLPAVRLVVRRRAWIPGAFSTSPMASARTQTISA